MPIYEYGCSNCNTIFEKILKMSEMLNPISEPCPVCNSESTIQQMATAAAIGDPIRLGIKRPDSGWGDVLSKVKAAHPKGNWNNQRIVPTGGR